jgi:hypothetical protein
MEYIVTAYSASTNTLQREINLINPMPDNAQIAQMTADAFAARLCVSTGIGDWEGRIELVDPLNHIRSL